MKIFEIKRVLYFSVISVAVSCTDIEDSVIFNGEIKTVNDTVTTIVELDPRDVVLDGITYGLMTRL